MTGTGALKLVKMGGLQMKSAFGGFKTVHSSDNKPYTRNISTSSL